MAGRKASTQEIKAEREGVLAKMWDRSFPVAALLPPASQPGAHVRGGTRHSRAEQAFSRGAGMPTECSVMRPYHWSLEGIHG